MWKGDEVVGSPQKHKTVQLVIPRPENFCLETTLCTAQVKSNKVSCLQNEAPLSWNCSQWTDTMTNRLNNDDAKLGGEIRKQDERLYDECTM